MQSYASLLFSKDAEGYLRLRLAKFMTMAREVLLNRYRTIIGDDGVFGDRMMNIATQIFEKFCIPGKETMPDDDVLFQTAYDDASAL